MQLTLPEPTGQHRIGLTKFDLYDENRPEINHPQGRLIPIQIYFPVSISGNTPQPKVFETRSPKTFLPLNVMGYSVPTDLSELAPGRHPLIFLNHGHDVAMTDYACIAEDIASHGYIVISIQHQLDTDKSPPKFWKERSITKYANVIDNILYVFEWLKQKQSDLFDDKLCLSKIGLIGHSLGGNALQFFASRSASSFKKKECQTLLPHDGVNTEIKECIIVLDAGGVSYPSSNQFPFFFQLSGERESYQKESGMYDDMVSIGHKMKYYPGSKHISFMDHGYINAPNPLDERENYFNGTRAEIDIFWKTLRQDIRDFLKQTGVI
jgi:predicted dienelactone hydrolase